MSVCIHVIIIDTLKMQTGLGISLKGHWICASKILVLALHTDMQNYFFGDLSYIQD